VEISFFASEKSFSITEKIVGKAQTQFGLTFWAFKRLPGKWATENAFKWKYVTFLGVCNWLCKLTDLEPVRASGGVARMGLLRSSPAELRARGGGDSDKNETSV
jgi:hypothetical protein